MSTTVDNKVVSIQFDNQKFESNVKTTMSTLDKLKEKLKFKDAANGLESLGEATSKVDMGKLESAVENVKVKFSALEVVALSVLSNIANKAFNVGERFVKSLTVDQISEGYNKYNRKIQAVQTVMAATRKEFEGLSDTERLQKVEEELDRMLWYTDETNYNFSDMADNVGKFTSANIELSKSVDAMQGIASLAAISGQGPQAATRVMYNFSQALGTGHMMIKDWMSIENANMATMEFKQTAIETAASLGKLKKKADGTFYAISKSGKWIQVTAENFRETLQYGWFDKEAMVETLGVYGNFATKLKGFTDEANIMTETALSFLDQYEKGELDLVEAAKKYNIEVETLEGHLKELSKDEYDIGRRAFIAGQEAKTFADTINYVKDAASSQWMKTFQYLFGNYEEAKALFTDLVGRFYNVFVQSSEKRNEILEGWHETGYPMMIDAFNNILDIVEGIFYAVKNAFHDVFGELDSQTLIEWTKRLLDFTEKIKMTEARSETIRGVFKGLFSVLKVVLGIAKVIFTIIKPIVGLVAKLAWGILKLTGALGNGTTKLVDWASAAGKVQAVADSIAGWISSIPEKLENVFRKLTGMSFAEAFEKMGKRVSATISKIRDALGKLFSKGDNPDSDGGLSEFGVSFETASDKMQKALNKFDKIKEKFIKIKEFFIKLGETLHLKEIVEIIKISISQFFDAFKSADTSGAENAEEKLTVAQTAVMAMEKVLNGSKNIFEGLIDVLNYGLKSSLATLTEAISQTDTKKLLQIVKAIRRFVNSVTKLLHGTMITEILFRVGKTIKEVSKYVKSSRKTIDSVRGVIDNFRKGGLKGLANGDGGGAVATFKNVAKSLLMIAGSLFLIALAFKMIGGMTWEEVGKGAAVIGGALVAMFGVMKAMSGEKSDPKKLSAVGTSMIFLSASLLIVSMAIKKLAELDPDSVVLSAISLAAVFGVLVAALKSLSSKKNDVSRLGDSAVALLLASAALSMIAKAIAKVAKIGDPGKIAVSAFALSIAVAAIGSALKKMTKSTKKTNAGDSKQLIAAAASILLVSIAISIIARALSKVAKIGDPGKIAVSALALGIALYAISTAIKRMTKSTKKTNAGDSKQLIAAAASILIVSIALAIVAKAIATIAEFDYGKMLVGAAALSAVMGVMAIIVGIFSSSKIDGKKVFSAAGAMFAMSLALLLIAAAISTIASNDWKQIAVAAGALAILMAVMAGILILMNKLKVGLGGLEAAGAILIMSVALIAMAKALQMLSVIPMEGLKTALLGLVATLAILGVAAFALSGAIVPMLGLAGVLIVLAAGAMLCAVAMDKFVNALSKSEENGPDGADNFVASIKRILGVLPELAKAFGEAIFSLAENIASNASRLAMAFATVLVSAARAGLVSLEEVIPQALQTFVKIVRAGIRAITIVAPSLIRTVGWLIDLLLKELYARSSSYAQSILGILVNILTELENRAEEIAELLTKILYDLIIGVLDGMIEKVPDYIDRLFKLVVAVVDGFATAIDNNKDALKAAFEHLGDSIVGMIDTFFGNTEDEADAAADESQGPFERIGRKIIRGFLRGIEGMTQEIIDGGANIIKTIISGIGTKSAEIADEGANTLIAFINSLSATIDEKAPEIKAALDKLGKSIKKAILVFFGIPHDDDGNVTGSSPAADKLKEIGSSLIQGIISGMNNLWNKVKNAPGQFIDFLKNGASGFVSLLEEKLKINSPSKVMLPIGSAIVEGIAVGMNDANGFLDRSASLLSKETVSTFSSALSKAQNAIDFDVDNTVTITPVLDLTRFNEDADVLNRQLANTPVMNLGATLSYAEQAAYAVGRSSVHNGPDSGYDKLTSLLQRLVESPPSQNHNEFYITGDEPEDIADEVSEALQRDIIRRNAVWA